MPGKKLAKSACLSIDTSCHLISSHLISSHLISDGDETKPQKRRRKEKQIRPRVRAVLDRKDFCTTVLLEKGEI